VIIPGPLTIPLRILLLFAVALVGAAAPSDKGSLSKIRNSSIKAISLAPANG